MNEEEATPASTAGDRTRPVPVARTASPDGTALVGRSEHQQADGVLRAELPGDLTSPRQARSAVRQALAGWGMEDLSDNAELLTSELVANAAEHTPGKPIGLRLRWHCGPAEDRDITCEVTDTSPDLPRFSPAGPDAERGRGLAIVAALATDSGVRPTGTGKTSWFTLAVHERTARIRQAEPNAELEAGA